MPETWDIVLCHAVEDSRLVESLAETLAGRGLRVWIDRTAPNTPKTIRVDGFVEALQGARWCVFLILRGRRPSRWQAEQAGLVRKATGETRQLGLRVVIVGPQELTWIPPELAGAAVFRVSGGMVSLADELFSLVSGDRMGVDSAAERDSANDAANPATASAAPAGADSSAQTASVPQRDAVAVGSGSQLDLRTPGRLAMASASTQRPRLGAWWMRQRRPLRRAIIGYVVVVVFAATYLLARAVDSKLSLSTALIPASLAAAPLVVAFIGDRITGLRFMSVEVSLSEVKVELNDDVSAAIQELGEMGPSVMPQIKDRIVESIAQPDRALLLRVNLGEGTAWWSTRVFLLAALASDYTGIQQLVFVDEGARRRFIGLASPLSAHWSLARRFPTYETAYRKIRSNLAAPTSPADPGSEVSGILEAWPAEFGGNEATSKEFATRTSLSVWLSDCLDSASIEWDGGPLTPLVRFQINARPSQHVAMTSGGNLVAVVDRFTLATQAERDVLLARLT